MAEKGEEMWGGGGGGGRGETESADLWNTDS